jgi:hypothetical protein
MVDKGHPRRRPVVPRHLVQHSLAVAGLEISGRLVTGQPLIHQFDRLIERAVPMSVDKTVRGRVIAGTAGRFRPPDRVPARRTVQPWPVRVASRLSSVVALQTRPPLCGGVDGRHPLHRVVNRMSAPFCRTSPWIFR